MPDSSELITLRGAVYDLRRQASALQEALAQITDPARLDSLLKDAGAVETALAEAEAKLRSAEATRATPPQSDAKRPNVVTRSMATTKLEATIKLRMTHIPTATYHLLNEQESPLVEIEVKNGDLKPRRLRISSRLEGYSADAIDTIELDIRGRPNDKYTVKQLPTLFPERIDAVRELTRASVIVLVEEIGGTIETHESLAVWLLARNAAPLAVRDPSTGGWVDLSRYFGAFVTPNRREIMLFLRQAARRHPEGRLTGYQGDVLLQVQAIFDALKQDADITYVNSLIAFNPEESARGQRVRLPRESLEEHQANCMDGTLLFASLLEAATLNPAIVIVPGHAFVGWETGQNSGAWEYLETTMIGANSFEEARAIGKQKATFWEQRAAAKPELFRRWSLRDLRAVHGVTPLE